MTLLICHPGAGIQDCAGDMAKRLNGLQEQCPGTERWESRSPRAEVGKQPQGLSTHTRATRASCWWMLMINKTENIWGAGEKVGMGCWCSQQPDREVLSSQYSHREGLCPWYPQRGAARTHTDWYR